MERYAAGRPGLGRTPDSRETPTHTVCLVSIPLAAGAVSTVIFALSTLPMLIKARQSKDLKSYSLSNLLLANLGNVVHSIYVVSLPVGPIWGLHTFYLVTTGLMLVWYLRYSAMMRIGRQRSA